MTWVMCRLLAGQGRLQVCSSACTRPSTTSLACPQQKPMQQSQQQMAPQTRRRRTRSLSPQTQSHCLGLQHQQQRTQHHQVPGAQSLASAQVLQQLQQQHKQMPLPQDWQQQQQPVTQQRQEHCQGHPAFLAPAKQHLLPNAGHKGSSCQWCVTFTWQHSQHHQQGQVQPGLRQQGQRQQQSQQKQHQHLPPMTHQAWRWKWMCLLLP